MPALSKVADSRENNKKEMTSNRLEPLSRGKLDNRHLLTKEISKIDQLRCIEFC